MWWSFVMKQRSMLLQAAAMGAENLDPLGLGRIDTRQLVLVGCTSLRVL